MDDNECLSTLQNTEILSNPNRRHVAILLASRNVLCLRFGNENLRALRISVTRYSSRARIHLWLYMYDGAAASEDFSTYEEALNILKGWFQNGRCQDCRAFTRYSRAHHCPGSFLVQPTTCTICLDVCKGTFLLPCGHSFHGVCLEKINHPRCPVCRRTLDRWVQRELSLCDGDTSDDEDVYTTF